MNYKIYAASFLLLTAVFPALSQPKRIYIAPDDHTDYMWTADEVSCQHAMLSMLDYYVALNDSTWREDNPYVSRWNCDGSYWIRLYRQNRTEAQFRRLLEQIRRGQVTVPLNTLQSVMGAAPLEAILRDMYYAGSLQREFGLDFPLAMCMEDQVLPWGLSSLWAGAGARYSWRGVCGCVTEVKDLGERPHEVYWYVGPDGRKVLMKWYSLWARKKKWTTPYRSDLGDYLEAANVSHAVADCKALMEDRARYPYDVAGAFGMGGDALSTLRRDHLDLARELSDEAYQVIISNELDFFRDMESHYADVLPSESVSYGSTEWGTAMASMGALCSEFRRSLEKLRTAEWLYALALRGDPGFAAGLASAREQAWVACGLFFEHDWTADSPRVTRKQRAEWQRRVASDLRSYVDTLYDRSLRHLSDAMAGSSDALCTYFILNPLGWKRSDFCDIPYDGPRNIFVRDASSGAVLPHQWIDADGQPRLRVFAREVPSFGYRLVDIVETGAEPCQEVPFGLVGNGLESASYRVEMDGFGTVTRLIDKRSGREWVVPAGEFRLNQLLSGERKGKVPPSVVRTVDMGPVSASLQVSSYFPLKHTVRLTLYADSERIDIRDVVEENFGNELTSYAFAFDLPSPWIRTEEAGAVTTVRQKSEGGDYADRICRLDWVAMNHFADISSGCEGVVISNRDALFMKTGYSTVDTLDVETPLVRILAGGKVNPKLGIDYQDGDSRFENDFSLLPYQDGFDPVRSMRLSLEHQNPLVAGLASGTEKDGKPAGPFSLLEISDPQVLGWWVKPSEDPASEDLVLRIWNLTDEELPCRISAPGGRIAQASLATHIEIPTGPMTLRKGAAVGRIAGKRLETVLVRREEKGGK